MIQFTVPIKLVSLANQHLHWRKRHAYTKAAREATGWAIVAGILERKLRRTAAKRLRIVFVCHGTRIRDRDNLASAVKPIRDEVCKWLGIDDSERSGRVEFFCDWGERSTKQPRVDVAILAEAEQAERRDGA